MDSLANLGVKLGIPEWLDVELVVVYVQVSKYVSRCY